MIRAWAILTLLGLAFGSAPLVAGESRVVVELFTSEGCSSCPPADALLAELASRPEVLALSFHVDYWDRFGWKDPFSSPEATERQQRYASVLGLATVYTPQIVIDGKSQAVGSDRAEVEHALGSARREHTEVPVVLDLGRGVARIQLGPAQGSISGAILLIGFDRRHASTVSRGENTGRNLVHTNVVRGIGEVGKFDGWGGAIEVPIAWQCDRIAVLMQASDGSILGVAVGDSNSL